MPGIGPRTAQRLALHLLRQPEEQIRSFADALLAARTQVGQCQTCFHLSADPTCEICRNPERSNGQICVVADSRDLLALERTREFSGRYHVLGGLISPMDGIGPDLLQISSLVKRVADDNIDEVILALTPSVEGDTTSLCRPADEAFHPGQPDRLRLAGRNRTGIRRRRHSQPGP